MPTTARFELQRSKQLKKLFTKKRLTKIWRDLVKEQMRRQDIKDLHDYYDFNYSLDARVETIVGKIMSGQYRAEIPLVFRIEKKLGICRHMLVPTPSDALVFQVLTDKLYESIIKEQPSKNAYYSRDRHHISLPHEHNESVYYPWFILWPRFQKDIWKFSKSHNYLVMTDLLNYFDNIGLRELRHTISAIVQTEEVYLDLLFSLIEDLSWTPDYLPKLHKGLPTIHIEAPRLLAHALLFEVDYILKKRTKNNFVRWMDDINFGVDDLETANRTLGEINDVLKSRGLALNLSKTHIVTAKEAENQFLFKENLRLSKISKRAKKLRSNNVKKKLAQLLAKELKKHNETCTAKNKEKVTKRYFTILGILKQPAGLNEAVNIFRDNPALRDSILNYFEKLPFSSNVKNYFFKMIDKTNIYDDVTLFRLVEALIRWDVPYNKSGKDFVGDVKYRLKKPKGEFSWFCWLFFLAKYGEPNEILTAIVNARKYGAKDVFFSRQRMAILPRAIKFKHSHVLDIWTKEISTGPSDSASVANNLVRILRTGFPSKNDKLYYYLFPEKGQEPYPIAKFLILCVLAAADVKKGLKINRDEVSSHIKNEWFSHWLREINPHWFRIES